MGLTCVLLCVLGYLPDPSELSSDFCLPTPLVTGALPSPYKVLRCLPSVNKVKLPKTKRLTLGGLPLPPCLWPSLLPPQPHFRGPVIVFTSPALHPYHPLQCTPPCSLGRHHLLPLASPHHSLLASPGLGFSPSQLCFVLFLCSSLNCWPPSTCLLIIGSPLPGQFHSL